MVSRETMRPFSLGGAPTAQPDRRHPVRAREDGGSWPITAASCWGIATIDAISPPPEALSLAYAPRQSPAPTQRHRPKRLVRQHPAFNADFRKIGADDR